jgi:hypothetical protein
VSSSSESDSDIELNDKPASKSPSVSPVPETNGDITMADRDTECPEPETHKNDSIPKPTKESEDFSSIYLRRIAAELGDDLDKVRGANDFTIRSVPILVHALKQGASCFSAEEQARVVGAANS